MEKEENVMVMDGWLVFVSCKHLPIEPRLLLSYVDTISYINTMLLGFY